MSNNKNISDEKICEDENTEKPSHLSRREFLERSAKGVGATALGATAIGTAALGVASTNDAAEDSLEASSGNGKGSDPEPVQTRASDTSAIDPATTVDTWAEPWAWRPGDWPGKQLNMVVTENAAPVAVTGTGFENVRPLLFSYGGIVPGPTVRMKGDETLSLQLINTLGLDEGETITGPYPDPSTLPSGVSPDDIPQDATPDWCLAEHTNGIHAAHTTNLHTHGLHVRPGSNPDGTISDNIILRVMSQADFLQRELDPDPNCQFLRVNEQVGSANYEFRLGNIGENGDPHPPGTHWYHPHSHGATHNQVAGGMAGFLIVEGDVDEAVNEQLAGEPNPDPQTPTGPYGYRERLILMQQINPNAFASDPDTPGGGRNVVFPVVNGTFQPKAMVIQPGAIERWRVLNGSVDGRGYLRFFVLKGQYELCNNQIGRANEDGSCTPLDTNEIEALKHPLLQLSMDGVTLVRETASGGAEYYVKDLNFPAPPNPLDLKSTDTIQDRLQKIANCYATEANVKAAYNRPNEVLMALGNRTDLFFAAPQLEAGEDFAVFTIVAQFDILHNENYEKGLRNSAGKGSETLPEWPGDVIVSLVVVKGDPVEGGEIDPTALPPVPDYLLPIKDEELRIPPEEAAARGVEPGSFRTRISSYSGWGNADFPIITVPPNVVAQNPELLNITYGPITPNSSQMVLLPPNIRTMAVDGRKFDPDDPIHPTMLLNTAEEWAVYNNSISLWSGTNQTVWQPHFDGQPVTRAEAAAEGLEFISTTTVDHPFHIHTNPFWLSRLEVTLADGTLVNIMDEPRWQDVVWLPRNLGRAVFRSRFQDYLGEYVNHCHILQHEDNGMMQLTEVAPAAENSNYVARFKVTGSGMSSSEVTAIYPRMSLNEAFSTNTTFVDPNPSTGQDYPGFNL